MFRIEFETDNDAFASGPPRYEIFKILTTVGTSVANDPDARLEGKVRDTNGNTVGTWQYTPDLDDSGDFPYGQPPTQD